MDDNIKEYSKELKLLIDKSNDSFEKQLNYISAGALGLSMVIVEKVVKDLSKTQDNWILILSWALLGLTLISNMASHVYSSNIHSKTYKEIQEEKYDYHSAGKRNKRIGHWNLVSISFLLMGLFFQILFVTLNITK